MEIILLIRRKFADEIPFMDMDGRFIDRDPKIDQIAQFFDYEFHIAFIISDGFLIAPASFLDDPHRIGPMPDRQDDLDILLFESHKNFAIMIDCRAIKFAFFRLDFRPLDSQPVSSAIQSFDHFRIFGKTMIRIARRSGDKIPVIQFLVSQFLQPPGRHFPLAPIVGDAAIDLISRGGNPPEETFGEIDVFFAFIIIFKHVSIISFLPRTSNHIMGIDYFT